MAVRTARTVVLRGLNILVDGSRFETMSGYDQAIGSTAVVSKYLCRKPASLAGTAIRSEWPRKHDVTPAQNPAN
jgi:hypothetical protein